MSIQSQRKYDLIHAENVEKYSRQIKAAYRNIINEIVGITYNLKLNPNNEFYFRNNPEVSKAVNDLLKQLYTEINGITVEGINSEWGVAVNKNNELALYAAGDKLAELPDAYKNKWFTNNDEARKAFLRRKESGLGLSDRIWRNTTQLKQELELALEVGIKEGRSAANLAREIKGYLNEPDKLFRRVRDNQSEINKKLKELATLKDNDGSLRDIGKLETEIKNLKSKGTLRLSKSAKIYNPGQGIYRSSYKNALRLTRNETNFSYNNSDFEKRKQQDFIVGVEIRTSPSHNPADDKGGIKCIDLQGKYPKDFDFTYRWHVNCKCQSLNILKSKSEIDKDLDRILSGKEPLKKSANSVTKKPANYTGYIKDNKKTWSNWKNQPRTFENN